MITAVSGSVYEAKTSYAAHQHTSLPDFRTIYQQYVQKVYRKCVGMLREEALAMDVTHDVFLKVFQKLPDFRGHAKLSSWIYRIAHNCCIDRLRRRKRGLSTGELFGDPPAPEETPYYQILERDLQQLDQVLAELSDDYRSLLLKKYRDEMSIKELAAELGLSESAVKMKIKRARDKARAYRRKMF